MKTYVQAVPSQDNPGQAVPSGPEEASPVPPVHAAVTQVSPSAGASGQAGYDPAAEPKEYRQLTDGAQYLPAEQPPTLLEILPAQYKATRPPVLYRLSKVSEPSRPEGRIAESRTYRAKAFSCGMFYKPVSRCLVDWEER